MKYEWLDDYYKNFKGASKDYKEEWDASRFLVGGKMFAMIGENNEGLPIVTVKADPADGEMLRKKFKGDIFPGYYMNKMWWNSVSLKGNVPDDILKDMLSKSYLLAFSDLTKKMQAEISGIKRSCA